jgi:long-chain acyl-CoA synthetase
LVSYAEKPWLKRYFKAVPPHAEYPEMSIPELLNKTASKKPDSAAIYFMGRKMSYKELKENVDRFATALARLGVKKGDVVAIHLADLPQFIIGYYGALAAGATVTAVSALFTPPEVKFQLNDSGAQTIITMDGKPLEIVNSVRKETKLKHVIVTSPSDYAPGSPKELPEKEGTHQMLNLIASNSPNLPKIKSNPKEDIAALQYTGGTTGVPKGAMLTQYNFVSNALQCSSVFSSFGLKYGEEVSLVNLPLFHIYGMTTCMNVPINMAWLMVLNADARDFNALLSLIKTTKPTYFPGVPTVYMRLLQMPGVEKYYGDLKSIKLCVSGAAPMPPETQRRFEEVTGGTIIEGYGLTEASPVTHLGPSKETRKIGSIGFPLPDTECRVVDIETASKLVPIGEAGELAMKGPQVMKGYWNKADETKNQLKSKLVNEAGPWLLTGDIAKMDEEGYFYIVDRKKDMIDVSGFKVYPREVEDKIFEHPSVAMAAVVGLPDPKTPGSEKVKAFVVLKPGVAENEDTKNSIIEFVKKSSAPYKVPKEIEFRKELPMTTVGKVLRRPLREEDKAKAAK